MAENEADLKFDYITKTPNFTEAIQNLSSVVGRNISFFEAPHYYDNYECATYMARDKSWQDKHIMSTFRN
jgi:hypothetical protein